MGVKPTSVRMLLAVAAFCLLAGWQLGAWIDGQGRLPSVPWSAVLVVWVVAGFVCVWALVARRRLRPKPGAPRMAPLVAARTAALALAGSRTGAIVFGLYGGLALRLLGETAVSAGRERLVAAALASLGGLVLCGVSLWLEHICRLPEEPEGATFAGRRAGPAGTAPGAQAMTGDDPLERGESPWRGAPGSGRIR
ncbi:MAG: DUF3180 domain-containing protein [Candidatus Nanopelagicales bacterium]